jgi:uncharacterized protein (AIM24 family)
VVQRDWFAGGVFDCEAEQAQGFDDGALEDLAVFPEQSAVAGESVVAFADGIYVRFRFGRGCFGFFELGLELFQAGEGLGA